MRNLPTANGKSGFDSRLNDGTDESWWFDATLRSYPPITLNPGDSLVSSISLAAIHSVPEVMRASDMSASPVATVSVLTVLAAAPSADAFRPSYCDRSQTLYHADNLQRNLLPSLAPPNPSQTPTLAQFETWYRRPWIDANAFLFDAPADYMPSYGQHIAFADSYEDHAARQQYKETVDSLFSEYEAFSERMFLYLASTTPKPDEMKQEAYERTLRARAFDISRYLLPLASNTSLGEIVNARTLESQVSHLLAHTHKEIRQLGDLLKRAATSPAYNVNQESLKDLVEQIRATSPELGARAEQELLREVRVAPTLVKYADPNQYEIETRQALRQVASELMGDLPVAPAPAVDLLEEEPIEVELASTLIYEHSHYSYRQIRQMVQAAGEQIRREVIDLGLRHRGRHDEMLRAFCAGQQFRFDILMDIGGFRDMHRHRRCIQIGQAFTTRHGYDVPDELETAGARQNYEAVMQRTASAVEQLASRGGAEAQENSQYAIPLGFRKRTLFKMDFAEVVYISELRTGPAGHFSYRNVAYAMYEAVAKKYPALAKYLRVHDVKQPVDLLKR